MEHIVTIHRDIIPYHTRITWGESTEENLRFFLDEICQQTNSFQEWIVVDQFRPEDIDEVQHESFNCLCGQRHLINLQGLHHKTTNSFAIVGSECIKKFMNSIYTTKSQFSNWHTCTASNCSYARPTKQEIYEHIAEFHGGEPPLIWAQINAQEFLKRNHDGGRYDKLTNHDILIEEPRYYITYARQNRQKLDKTWIVFCANCSIIREGLGIYEDPRVKLFLNFKPYKQFEANPKTIEEMLEQGEIEVKFSCFSYIVNDINYGKALLDLN